MNIKLIFFWAIPVLLGLWSVDSYAQAKIRVISDPDKVRSELLNLEQELDDNSCIKKLLNSSRHQILIATGVTISKATFTEWFQNKRNSVYKHVKIEIDYSNLQIGEIDCFFKKNNAGQSTPVVPYENKPPKAVPIDKPKRP